MYPNNIAKCIGNGEIDMVMNILRKNFAEFLRKSQIKLEITGFDMDAFERAMHRDLSSRLNAIESIVREDGELLSDARKLEAIKWCFERDE